MSFESGRILPLHPASDDALIEAEASPRRLQVEAERAARCDQLRETLATLGPAAAAADARVLEIGSGHGHFLEAYATAHRTHFCLGIDYCSERTRRAARKQQRHAHGNLYFLRAEAWEFLDSTPPDFRFDVVFVLFPDPWPKRRHRKYRLLSSRFLNRLAACTRAGATLYLRTDAAFYFAEATEAISVHPAWQILPEARWPFEQPTVFQTKAAQFQSLAAINVSPATPSETPGKRPPSA